jgi:HSP20 family protein
MNEKTEKPEVASPSAVTKPVPKDEGQNKLAPMFIEAEKMLERLAEATNETATKAFDFFRDRGGEWGKELDDWFRAESELLRPVPVEILEFDNKLFVKAAVPGFKPNEIEVSLKDDKLYLSGTAQINQEKKEGNVVHSEWKSDRFLRQLPLPAPVDVSNVKAILKDGILELTLPKAAPEEAKKISVAAG